MKNKPKKAAQKQKKVSKSSGRKSRTKYKETQDSPKPPQNVNNDFQSIDAGDKSPLPATHSKENSTTADTPRSPAKRTVSDSVTKDMPGETLRVDSRTTIRCPCIQTVNSTCPCLLTCHPHTEATGHEGSEWQSQTRRIHRGKPMSRPNGRGGRNKASTLLTERTLDNSSFSYTENDWPSIGRSTNPGIVIKSNSRRWADIVCRRDRRISQCRRPSTGVANNRVRALNTTATTAALKNNRKSPGAPSVGDVSQQNVQSISGKPGFESLMDAYQDAFPPLRESSSVRPRYKVEKSQPKAMKAACSKGKPQSLKFYRRLYGDNGSLTKKDIIRRKRSKQRNIRESMKITTSNNTRTATSTNKTIINQMNKMYSGSTATKNRDREGDIMGTIQNKRQIDMALLNRHKSEMTSSADRSDDEWQIDNISEIITQPAGDEFSLTGISSVKHGKFNMKSSINNKNCNSPSLQLQSTSTITDAASSPRNEKANGDLNLSSQLISMSLGSPQVPSGKFISQRDRKPRLNTNKRDKSKNTHCPNENVRTSTLQTLNSTDKAHMPEPTEHTQAQIVPEEAPKKISARYRALIRGDRGKVDVKHGTEMARGNPPPKPTTIDLRGRAMRKHTATHADTPRRKRQRSKSLTSCDADTFKTGQVRQSRPEQRKNKKVENFNHNQHLRIPPNGTARLDTIEDYCNNHIDYFDQSLIHGEALINHISSFN